MARGSVWFGPGVPHRWLRWTRRGRRRMAQVSAQFLAPSVHQGRDGAPDLPAGLPEGALEMMARRRAEHSRFARAASRTGASVFYVSDGRVAETGPWLYAWTHLPSGRVVHVGTTTLDPRVRAWAHLKDPDPDRGRVAALARSRTVTVSDGAGDPAPMVEADAFEVAALRLPDDAPRPAVKASLLLTLSDLGLLADGVSAADAEPDRDVVLDRRSQRAVDAVVRTVRSGSWP